MIHEHHHHHESECCEHEHHHEEEEEGRGRIVKIIAASVLLIVASVIEHKTAWQDWQYLLLFLVPYLIVGCDGDNSYIQTDQQVVHAHCQEWRCAYIGTNRYVQKNCRSIYQ